LHQPARTSRNIDGKFAASWRPAVLKLPYAPIKIDRFDPGGGAAVCADSPVDYLLRFSSSEQF
jgi:hypothetical protein